MKKKPIIGLAVIFVTFVALCNFVSFTGEPSAENATGKTLTQLPLLPDISFWSRFTRSKTELLHQIVDVKLSTYPEESSISYRAGKHRTTGFFASFEPRGDQVKKVAPHYDLFLLSGHRADLVPLIKQSNPSAKVLLYIANSLTTVATLLDAGSVDAENTEWILKNHSDWLLKSADGRPIQGASWSPKFWPDPGNRQWQQFFVKKINQAVKATGGLWDGVLLDEFLTTHTSHMAPYLGGSGQQANYVGDEAFQRAQLDFLRNVAPGLNVPLIPNVESFVLNPWSPAFNPEFFTEVQHIAGGAEAEVFALHAPNRHGFMEKNMVEIYLDRAIKTPAGKMMLLNSSTAGLEGNIDLTLYVYFTYLLVAGPERPVFWTFKEGDSSIPHFWFREFDLDLGPPRGERRTAGQLWTRDFANAVVVVNPNDQTAQFGFQERCFDVLGKPIQSPIALKPHSGVLLIRNKGILPALP